MLRAGFIACVVVAISGCAVEWPTRKIGFDLAVVPAWVSGAVVTDRCIPQPANSEHPWACHKVSRGALGQN